MRGAFQEPLFRRSVYGWSSAPFCQLQYAELHEIARERILKLLNDAFRQRDERSER